MKKKEAKKLKLNTAIILSLLFMFVLEFGLIFSIMALTTFIVSKKPDVIAYKETAAYLFIIIPAIILAGVGFMPYSILEKKYNQDKRKNQKIPKHRKPAKYEKQFKNLKAGVVVFNILLGLISFSVCVNSRWELHNDGIYKVNFIGKEKLICPWNEITGFKIQVGKSRSRTSTTYFPEVVTITDKRNFYFSHYKNQMCKREFYLSLKDNPSAEIEFDQLLKYYSKFSKDNKKLVDLLIDYKLKGAEK